MLRLLPSRHVPAGSPRTPAQLDESRVHHRLFLDLSSRYEGHCRTTGRAESPALCAAAERFRRERSLAALIAFADLLETLGDPPPRRC